MPTARSRATRPIQALTWDYPVQRRRARSRMPEAVLREINGYTVADRKQIPSYQELKDDGSTACGGWMYTGVYPETSRQPSRSRKPDGPDGPGSHHGWAFAWPSNRRTLYNRASADPEGKPWSERKKHGLVGRGRRRVDRPRHARFRARPSRPTIRPDWSKRPHGMDALGGDRSVHHGGRRQVPAVRAVRPEGRAAADALRAGGEPGAQPALRPADQSRRRSSGRGRATSCTTPSATRASPTCSPRSGSPSCIAAASPRG